MNDMEFENQLRIIAGGLEYPRTPDIAGSVMARLRRSPTPVGRGARGEGNPRLSSKALAWSLTVILVLFSSLMLIPSARAAVIEFIQIGVVRIFPRSAEPTPETISTAVPEIMSPLTATPGEPMPSLLPLLDSIAGETKLAEAQEIVPYLILLPTYPSGLGTPDRVYIQDAEGAMMVLVWVNPQQPEDVVMSLHFIPSGSWAVRKTDPVIVQETEVNGQRAAWTVGPYPLILSNGDIKFTRLIDGHVLIWSDGDITYRLETDLSLDEAVKIAESLEPAQ